MSAVFRSKVDYNIILETIEELSRDNLDEVEVLNYLVKIKMEW